MLREQLIVVGTCDIAGPVRGKGFPASELTARVNTGIGWMHSNQMQVSSVQSSILLGTGGDLMIVPDKATEANIDFADGTPPEHFFLGNIRETDGGPWRCCPREFLRRAVDALKTFLAEYGPRQFEVTVKPAPGLKSGRSCGRHPRDGAHRGVPPGQSRNLLANARRQRRGVHIHFSLSMRRPRTSPDDRRRHGAVAGVVSQAHAKPLGADRDRHRSTICSPDSGRGRRPLGSRSR